MSVADSQPLPPASILGVGAITPLGRDLNAIAKLLEQPHRTADGVLRVNPELLSDAFINGPMRRADRFAKMAALAAIDAWNSSGLADGAIPGERIGILLSSGFGPHGRGFRFLDGILDSGDAAASPTDFSHSVHGAASAYITRLLGIRGPSLPITDFEMGFEQAVKLAQCWLSEGACDRILVGAVEELGEVMLSCASRMLDGFADLLPGEGAVFLVLAPSNVRGMTMLDATAKPQNADLLLIEDPPMLASRALPRSILAPRTVTFTSHFGHSAGASAFDVLGGLLALRTGRSLGTLVASEMQSAIPRTIDNVATFRTSSDARSAMMLVSRTSGG